MYLSFSMTVRDNPDWNIESDSDQRSEVRVQSSWQWQLYFSIQKFEPVTLPVGSKRND